MPHEDFPFRSPRLDSTQPAADEEAWLLRIVWYQRLAAMAILVFVAFYWLPIGLSLMGISLPIRIFSLVYWCFIIFSVFIEFRLAQQVYSTMTAVLCGVLMLLPFVGLIVLILTNQKALGFLSGHGLVPGFLGMSCLEATRRLRAKKG